MRVPAWDKRSFRYIEIPVTIEARLAGGGKQHFSGTYTLRRSVVDGATLEQRQWRIYKAHIVEGRVGYGMR